MLKDVIKEYKIHLNKKIDCLLYQFYFEELELSNEANSIMAHEKKIELQKLIINKIV